MGDLTKLKEEELIELHVRILTLRNKKLDGFDLDIKNSILNELTRLFSTYFEK
jgi:hypothetical protein